MSDSLITIDGSQGEGGGQVLRSALGLGLVTQQGFRIEQIRAGRKNPGVKRQHLASILAAAAISGAEVEGAELGSSTLVFKPSPVEGGHHRFAVGSAGSAVLVLQAILPALLVAQEKSMITVVGGTHVSFAPTYDFMARSFIPTLNRMGANVRVELQRCGFMPAGGGKIRMRVEPIKEWRRLDLEDRGALSERGGVIYSSHIRSSVAKREKAIVMERLGWNEDEIEVLDLGGDATGPGNALALWVNSSDHCDVVTELGTKGLKAESVAKMAAKKLLVRQESEAVVGPYLADQLLVPMAMAGGGSFTTVTPTEHTKTNAAIIRHFLDRRIDFDEMDAQRTRVTIR